MTNNNVNSAGGGGFLGLMFLIFMTLKLMGYITWSWWWITLPLWGGIALIISIVTLVVIINKLLNKK